METTMKAIAFRQYGTADVLQKLDMPQPTLAPDQVLVRVAAAGVNPSDPLFRSGALKLFIRVQLPFIPGLDIAGTVAEVGAEVKRFRPGDRVYAMLPNSKMGGYAEYAAVDEKSLAPIPAGVSFTDAAAVPCAALTSLQALRDEAEVKPGTRVLVNGASGGVGSFAVQIAKAMGAHVTAVTSSRNIEFAKQLGADEAFDYTSGDITKGAMRFDVVFDAVGLVPFARWKNILRPGGVGVTVNLILGSPIAKLRARLTGGGKRWKSLLVKPIGADLEQLNTWLASGAVRPMIEQCYPLDQAREAHRQIETKRTRGKLVLTVDPQLTEGAR